MLPLHVTLQYYKRQEIREAMVAQCRGKEVAVKYTDRFGKRPQILIYDRDVLAHAQDRATSFHVSEETWTNPMQLHTGLQRHELNALRAGWDLVLDVDFPVWEATRIISNALVRQLRSEGVPDVAITAKFSGNKGFHIAVPFEAFPDTYLDDAGNEVLMSDFFPEGVKTMVEYLVSRLDGPENGFALSEQLVSTLGLEALEGMLVTVDAATGAQVVDVSASGNEFVCVCGFRDRSPEEYRACPACGALLRPIIPVVDDLKTRRKVDLAIDTMLVSSRHMYRLLYSLHEKSGLASVPVLPDDVRSFDKAAAEPVRVRLDVPFLVRDVPRGCATPLLRAAIAFRPPGVDERKAFSEIVWEGDAAPESLFPPPITKMLAGMADGKKRALFVLTNFLRSIGWSYEMIEARLREWNAANPEPLRENVIAQHLRYHRQKERVLPPNFDNDMYYKDLGVLVHDELSQRVKNPVQYVRLRMKRLSRPDA